MTGAVLAGGKSRRMGFNKALIKINNETIIERSLALFKGVFDDTFIVANGLLGYESLNTLAVSDIFKGAGSLGGIYTALFHSTTDHTFVAACDMPYMNKQVIKRILDSYREAEAIVPFINEKFHPLHAVYHRRCMKPIEAMIKDGNLRINDLLNKIHVKKLVEADFHGLPVGLSVENINTKEELEKLKLSL